MTSKLKQKTIVSKFILLIVLTLFLINLTTILTPRTATAAEPTDNPGFMSITPYRKGVQTASDLMEHLAPYYGNKNLTININGASRRLIQLSDNNKAFKLPQNRYVLKHENGDISILPEGTNTTYLENKYLIIIPEENLTIQVQSIETIPIENFTRKARYAQSIKKLDKYKTTITFTELTNPVLSDNMHAYIIDWGDGNVQNHTPNQINTHHTYKKSGTYQLTITIQDDFGYSYQIRQRHKVEYEGHLVHTYLWVEENKEPVAVTTSTFSLLSFLGFILTETGKYKFLALIPLIIPLYTRIQKEDVLDQFVRGQIYGFIKTNPGVHYNQIRREIGVKNGTLSYHLSVLEKTELIKSRREGVRYRAFYPTGTKFPQVERFRLTELQLDILTQIKNKKGINQKEIAQILNKKPQTINYNIKILAQTGLIAVQKKGRKTFCYPTEVSYSSPTSAQ